MLQIEAIVRILEKQGIVSQQELLKEVQKIKEIGIDEQKVYSL